MRATDVLCVAMAFCYSIMAVTFISPKWCFGPDSRVAYWTKMDDSGEWFARVFGIWMGSIVLSPWYAGMDKMVLTKIYIAPNVMVLGLIIQAIFFLDSTGPGKHAILPFKTWYMDLAGSVLLLVLNSIAFVEATKKASVGVEVMGSHSVMDPSIQPASQKSKDVFDVSIKNKCH
jgi:hypothetical protein